MLCLSSSRSLHTVGAYFLFWGVTNNSVLVKPNSLNLQQIPFLSKINS